VLFRSWKAEDTAAIDATKGMGEVEPWLAKLGLKNRRDYLQVYIGATDQEVLKRMLWQRPALLSVASLNNNEGRHMVFWDGAQLWDPSNKRSFQFLSSVFLCRIFLLTPSV
jgi:hypothetical protein